MKIMELTSIKKPNNFINLKCYYKVECAGNLVVEKYRVNMETNSADTSAACTNKKLCSIRISWANEKRPFKQKKKKVYKTHAPVCQ